MLNDTFRKYFVYGVIGIVSAAILAGFFVAGSPTTQRMVRFDQERVNDLQSLQYEIINYWQAKQKLPIALADLNDPTRGVIVPKDAETGVDYEYVVKGPLAFSLCATFNISSASEGTSNYGKTPMAVPIPATMPGERGYPEKALSPDSWSHDAGRVCFDRSIDTDFYKPLESPIK